MAMDLNLLEVLDAVLQAGTVTGAAARLGISVGAASHALDRLREQLGDPVMVRAGNNMTITPRAQELKPRVQTVLDDARRLLSPDHGFEPARLERRFVIRITDALLTVVGPKLDRIVRAEAPGVVLQYLPPAVDDVAALRNGDADLAAGRYGNLPPELRIRTIFTEAFACVVRADHPTVRARLSLKQYLALEHVQVSPLGQPGNYVDDVLTQLGTARRTARLVAFFLSAMQLVAASDYILTVGERLARQLAAGFGLRVLPPPLPLRSYTLSLLWHPRLDSDPANAWLRDCIFRAGAEIAPNRHTNPRLRLTDHIAPRKRKRTR
jgi:DNA-binding transcriptional LysR family regulator